MLQQRPFQPGHIAGHHQHVFVSRTRNGRKNTPRRPPIRGQVRRRAAPPRPRRPSRTPGLRRQRGQNSRLSRFTGSPAVTKCALHRF
jgi:hypothetical protein